MGSLLKDCSRRLPYKGQHCKEVVAAKVLLEKLAAERAWLRKAGEALAKRSLVDLNPLVDDLKDLEKYPDLERKHPAEVAATRPAYSEPRKRVRALRSEQVIARRGWRSYI